MKNATFVILLLIAVKSVAAKPCESDNDCDKNQCCVFRDIIFDDYRECESRLNEGELCMPDDDCLTIDGNYYLRCPCMDTLICKPQSYLDLPFLGRIAFNERCTSVDSNSTDSASVTTTETQSSSAES